MAIVFGAVIALIFGICTVERLSAQPVDFGAANATMFRNALDAIEISPELAAKRQLTPEDLRQRIKAEVNATFPVFVFIPGVMGSKLTRNGEVIWGRSKVTHTAAPPDLEYKEDDNVETGDLENFDSPMGPTPIYAPAMAIIRELNGTSGTVFLPFSYDWRQSNALSANKFSKWLCKAKKDNPAIADRSFVFLAHSMGGLIFKYWLKNEYSSPCPDETRPMSDWLRISRVVFGGTPHFGSPDSLYRFGAERLLYFDSDKIYARFTRLLDPSRPINKYGASFPSGYQLLPITESDCGVGDAASPIIVRRKDKTESRPPVFSADTWKNLKWPHTVAERDTFLKERLPDLLRKAKDFLCELASYDIERDLSERLRMANVEVWRVYNRGSPTNCMVVAKEKRRSFEVEPQKCPEKGDGTVPTLVAIEKERNVATQLRVKKAMHQYLFQSSGFRVFLEDYHKKLHRDWQLKVNVLLGEDTAEFLGEFYCKAGWIIPSAPKEASLGTTGTVGGSRSEESLAAQIAKWAFEKCKVKSTCEWIARAAKARKQDTARRSDAMRVYADVCPDNKWNTAWRLNDAALINLRKNNFVAALDLANRAIEKASELNAPEADDITANAAWTGAIAAFELRDGTMRKRLCDLAIENENDSVTKAICP